MKATGGLILTTIFAAMTTPPAWAGVSVFSGLTYEKRMTTGETHSGVIRISNAHSEIQEVMLYQTDYLFYSDGRNRYDEPGTTDRSNADWITFSPRRLAIPPKDVSEVHYTVTVPDDDFLEGTYWSMIMVEAIAEAAPAEAAPDADEPILLVRQVVRHGLQMVSHVSESRDRRIQFVSPKLLKGDSARFLQLDVVNVGKVSLIPTLWVELYDEQGSYLGKHHGGRLRTYPGTSVRFKIDLSTVPIGTYKAMVVGDCGGEDVFGASYTLKLTP